jgi:hypothetical protein
MYKSDRGVAFVGIDPSAIHGKTSGGAIVVVTVRKETTKIECICLKKNTEKDIVSLFKKSIRGKKCYAVLEKVHSFPGQGVSSTFKFGQGYGWLRCLLMALDIPYEDTPPKKWQKWYAMSSEKGETRTHWKNRLKAKAQQHFPEIKVTLGNADALLIAYYCMRTDGVSRSRDLKATLNGVKHI